MGSIIAYDEECPKCKQEKGFSDYYYRNGEEYFSCQNTECNFEYRYEWKRDDNRKLVTRDGTDNHEFDNLIMVETVFENGDKTITELESNKNK